MNDEDIKKDLKAKFLEYGWQYSHAIANEEICSDGSCYRCRLAELLHQTEKRKP